MTLKPTVAALLIALAAQPALADRYHGSYYTPRPAYTTVRVADQRYGNSDVVYARVVDVDPIVRHITVSTPHRECWDETVYREQPRGVGAAIAGGIIGAAVGHQFGDGRGQDAMTVVGAIAGSTIAHNVVQRNSYGNAYPETVQRCEMRDELHEEERIEGYNVTYEVNGQRYRTRMRDEPGNEIAVRVAVTPAGY